MLRILFVLIFMLQHRNCFTQYVSSTENVTSKYVTEDNRSDFVPRVANGRVAKLGDVPYQLSFKLKVQRHYASFCGGTLIGPSKVVSAAHCFVDKSGFLARCSGNVKVPKSKLRKTHVVAGNLQNVVKYQDGGQWRKLKSMNVPGRYKFPSLDISVGFTTVPFVLDDHVKTIPYATEHKDYEGECRVSGYGRIEYNQRSDVLLLADLELIRTQKCSKMHHRNMKKFVCTSQMVSDVGKGDSGGPLVCKMKDPADQGQRILVGVVSGYRHRCGTFFTRVSSYKNFITRGNAIRTLSNNVVVLLCLLNGGILVLLFCFIFLRR